MARHDDETVRTAMDAIRRIVRALRESARGAEKDVGISGAQLFVLHRLGDRGPLTINELAGATATHQSSVSVVVGRLVERGLVTRGVSATDRRRREVALTGAGRRLLARAPGAAQERLVAALAGMPRKLRRELADRLVVLVHAMHADRTPADMFFEDRAPDSMGPHGSPRPTGLGSGHVSRRRQASPVPRARGPRAR
jgi:DNA-binding MarR family transcriptional regulator